MYFDVRSTDIEGFRFLGVEETGVLRESLPRRVWNRHITYSTFLCSSNEMPVYEYTESPITASSPSIDIHGVKRDLDKTLVHTVTFNTELYWL